MEWYEILQALSKFSIEFQLFYSKNCITKEKEWTFSIDGFIRSAGKNIKEVIIQGLLAEIFCIRSERNSMKEHLEREKNGMNLGESHET